MSMDHDYFDPDHYLRFILNYVVTMFSAIFYFS